MTGAATPFPDSRCTWAAVSARTAGSAVSCVSTKWPVTNSAITSSGWCAISSNRATGVSASPSGRFGPPRRICDEALRRRCSGGCVPLAGDAAVGRRGPMGNATEEQLRDLAARGATELDGATAIELLRWTDENFGGTRDGSTDACNYVVASNMADAVLVDLAVKVRPGVPVLFLDTGYHFAETIGTRDAVQATYDIQLINVTPEQTVAEHEAKYGKNPCANCTELHLRLRKVEPLANRLRDYSAWVTGLRRVEAPTRANAPLISFDEQFKLVKVNPIAAWSDQEFDAYIAEHDVLVNPLIDEGYTSIGCAPCTTKPAPGADKRSGRWAGTSKTECGLHVS